MTSAMRSVKERPQKILVIALGSRGDIQPYVAVAKALLAAGYEDVVIATCCNHEALVRECGIAYVEFSGDCEEILKGNDALMKSMADGSTLAFFKGVSEEAEKFSPLQAAKFKQVMQDFQPDLVISGALTEFYGFASLLWHKVPVFFALTNYLPPNPKRMIFGMPNLPFKLNSWVATDILLGGIFKGMQKGDKLAQDILGYKLTELTSWRLYIDEADCPDMLPRLVIAHSQCFKTVFPSCEPSVVPVGVSALSAKFEEEVGSATSPTNFGSSAALERVRGFLAAGEKPIFMGWGSMICKSKEYMVQLVASAARESGYRAIIQAGWAHLSFEVLKSCCKDKSLVEYAEKHFLFIENAPHEWLFPQCACTVQHGGAGTCAASLRSGTPCVITPVFLDQFDNAHMVNQLGVGVGFEKKQLQSISVKELADAIRKCTASDDMRAKAKEMAVAMHSQDGSKRVAEYVGDFWEEHVKTGRQLGKAERYLEKRKAAKASRCTCFAGLQGSKRSQETRPLTSGQST